jgi:hypothetical protein
VNHSSAADKPSITTDFLDVHDFFRLAESEQDRVLAVTFGTIEHFFGDVAALFSGVADPRNPNKIDHPLGALALAGVLMFLFRLQARRQVALLLRTRAAAETFNTLFGTSRFPHGDTLDYGFSRLDAQDMQAVVSGMPRRLIANKTLNQFRLLGKYFVVAGDGTGILSFPKRHCAHCLTRKHNGKTLYSHSVLEAKLVTSHGLALSLMTEFVENPGPNPTKQDCELKAFYRMAENLKAAFPRLPIMLTLDGLYAKGPVFDICRRHGWGFMIVLKDKDLPSVNEEFASLCPLQPENRLTWISGKQKERRQDFRWVEGISYMDSAGREHCLSVIECLETKPNTHGTPETTKFKWVTNVKVTKANVAALANEGGRIRWKIENEGFNAQKNSGYGLEHAYTTNPTSAKVFYFLLQIAHTIEQLITKGSLLRKALLQRLGSGKNLALRLLEAFRTRPLTRVLVKGLAHCRFQIRFCPDTS